MCKNSQKQRREKSLKKIPKNNLSLTPWCFKLNFGLPKLSESSVESGWISIFQVARGAPGEQIFPKNKGIFMLSELCSVTIDRSIHYADNETHVHELKKIYRSFYFNHFFINLESPLNYQQNHVKRFISSLTNFKIRAFKIQLFDKKSTATSICTERKSQKKS